MLRKIGSVATIFAIDKISGTNISGIRRLQAISDNFSTVAEYLQSALSTAGQGIVNGMTTSAHFINHEYQHLTQTELQTMVEQLESYHDEIENEHAIAQNAAEAGKQ